MSSYNRVILLGNLTRDPERKALPSGTAVTEFTLAMTRSWKDQATGEKREAPCFVDCKVMGRQAEVIAQHKKKGDALLVEGRLDYRTWEGKDGSKRNKLEVFVENFQFVGGGRRDQEDRREPPARPNHPTRRDAFPEESWTNEEAPF